MAKKKKDPRTIAFFKIKDIRSEMLYILDKFPALLCDDFVGSEREKLKEHGMICPSEDALWSAHMRMKGNNEFMRRE